ncbi:uncharacterized protein LOC112539352 [Tetranychus urticae]|uniref:Intradiol ring-cleavage dioxygenases domain-containing protein n=1 Tax=Tetranychus urticae TaxID=32264 RepID=T1KSJ1_TETUR|nr:uncharacterized protein LOC112539352 [Tetranychus urticae]
MSRITCIFAFCVYLVIVTADPDRPGKYLKHDRTVINCARYKREANQHQCVLSPFNTEGPYFLPDDLQRSDITDGQTGIKYSLTIALVNSNDCSPLENMFVHIWHASAIGEYSGVGKMGPPPGPNGPGEEHDFHGHEGFGGPGGPKQTGKGRGGRGPKPPQEGREGNMPRPTPVSDERFLRGYQVTDQNGFVNFNTILPGWYAGRATHIHIEVYPRNTTEQSAISYVGQIFFREDLPESLKLLEPYSKNPNRITLNEDDGIYTNGHGNETTAKLEAVDSLSYKSTMIFGIDPDAHTKSQV